MALAVTGIVTSRAQQEHGKPVLACCLHPRRRTLFMVAGQVIDELDTRTGALVSRIVSDLVDPIVRIECLIGSKGHEYLLLLSSANELRIWDIENRFHLASVNLGSTGGQKKNLPGITVFTVTTYHDRCLLLYSREGSPLVEILHIQRQIDHPSSTTLLTTLLPLTTIDKKATVTSIATHSTLPFVAVGVSDGTVTVFWVPLMDETVNPSLQQAIQEASTSSIHSTTDTSAHSTEDTASSSTTKSSGGGFFSSRKKTVPIASSSPGPTTDPATLAATRENTHTTALSAQGSDNPIILFAATLNADLTIIGGKLRRSNNTYYPPPNPDGSSTIVSSHSSVAKNNPNNLPPPNPVALPDYNDYVSALAFHPTLPLVSGADGHGRIVVYRIGYLDGLHASIASRDYVTAPTSDDTPRIITSLIFHATVPKLTSLAYAPGNTFYAPQLSCWCYAHAGLPPLPSPVTPSLAALLTTAAQDTLGQTVAHIAQPPTLLAQPTAGGTQNMVIYLSGRAIVTNEIFSSSGTVGVGAEDEEVDLDGFGSAWETGADMTSIIPTVPHHGTGIMYNTAVSDVLSVPRSWFVHGGEGEGLDIANEDVYGGTNDDEGKHPNASAIDELNSGSLAEFAARLTAAKTGSNSNNSTTVTGKNDDNRKEKENENLLGIKKRLTSPPECSVSVDAVVYVQTKTEAVAIPPRFAFQHSLQVRQLGISAAGLSSAGNDENFNDPESRNLTNVKRLCYLPSYGPGGPLIPLSVQRSPSGRYFMVRFAYVTELSPQIVAKAVIEEALRSMDYGTSSNTTNPGSHHSASGTSGSTNATDLPPLSIDFTNGGAYITTEGTPAEGNGAAVSLPDKTLFVIVGPIDREIDPATGLPIMDDHEDEEHAEDEDDNHHHHRPKPIFFRSIRSDVVVSPLQTAVDATFLPGDRLLVVRRPLVPAKVAPYVEYGTTAYNISIDALDYDYEAAERERTDKERYDRETQLEKERLEKEKHKGLEKIQDLFKGIGSIGGSKEKGEKEKRTDTDGTETNNLPSSSANEPIVPLKTDPYAIPVRFAMHDPVARVFTTPFVAPLSHTAENGGPSLSNDSYTPKTDIAASSTATVPSNGPSHPSSSPTFTNRLLPPGTKTVKGNTDTSCNGDVLLYATRFRSTDEETYGTAWDRIVLRYSNNAFGDYDIRNPHGYAIVDAYEHASVRDLSSNANDNHTAGSTEKKKGIFKGLKHTSRTKDTSADRNAVEPDYGLLALRRFGEEAAIAGDGGTDTAKDGTNDGHGTTNRSRSNSRLSTASPSLGSSASTFVSPPITSTLSPHYVNANTLYSHALSYGTDYDYYHNKPLYFNQHHIPHHDAMLESSAWFEHEANGARCPVTIRPALVLAPGEQIGRLTWQANDTVWGDQGTHDPTVEPVWQNDMTNKSGTGATTGIKKLGIPPTANGSGNLASSSSSAVPSVVPRKSVPNRLTLPLAIAQGNPLLSILTTHRLLICTAALQILVSVPVLAPLGSNVGMGLGNILAPTSMNQTGNFTAFGASALACCNFGVWRGTFAAPHGHGHGYGAYAYDGLPGRQIQTARRAAQEALDNTNAIVTAENEPYDEHTYNSRNGTIDPHGNYTNNTVRSRHDSTATYPYNDNHSTVPPPNHDTEDNVPTTTLILGAGYTGIMEDVAVIPGGIPTASATVSPSSLGYDMPLAVSSPVFGLVPQGLAPPDNGATFISGVIANSVANAAARATTLTSPLPASRLTDTIVQDDIVNDVVNGVPWRSPIVSHVWMGSALLFTTATGEIWYVTPTGRTRRVAALEPWQRDAILICATSDRIVYAVTHWQTGRTQIRTRAFAPLEPLVASTLDHSIVRPKPLLSLFGNNTYSTNPYIETPPHPIVAALAHTLSVGIAIYGPKRGTDHRHNPAKEKISPSSATQSSSSSSSSSLSSAAPGNLALVYLTGQSAIAGASLAALARDYTYVRDVVVRYSHPKRIGGGGSTQYVTFKEDHHSNYGISRTVIAALEERGLLDLAFYVAQGNPLMNNKGDNPYSKLGGNGKNGTKGTNGNTTNPNDHEDDNGPGGNGNDTNLSSAAKAWIDETGFLKGLSIIPLAWRASLAIKRGRLDHAIWALLSEDPVLASTLVHLTKRQGITVTKDYFTRHSSSSSSSSALPDDHDLDLSAVRLPHPYSTLAGKLRALARVCISIGNYRAALFCYDVAGDHTGAFYTLVLAAASAVMNVARTQYRDIQTRLTRKKPKRTLDDNDQQQDPSLDDTDGSNRVQHKGAIVDVEGSLGTLEIDLALTNLLGSNKDRFPALSIAVGLYRKSIADSTSILEKKNIRDLKEWETNYKETKKTNGQLPKGGSKKNETEDEASDDDSDDDDDDYGSSLSVDRLFPSFSSTSGRYQDTVTLLDSLRGQVYPPSVGNRKERIDALIPIDYSLGTSAKTVARYARKMLELSPVLAAPALAQCPYLCLTDETFDIAVKMGEETNKRTVSSALSHYKNTMSTTNGSSTPSTTVGAVPVPELSATVHTHVTFTGGTIDPVATPSLLTGGLHLPLAYDTLQKHMGTTAPTLAFGGITSTLDGKGSNNDSPDTDDDDDDENNTNNTSLEAMLGLSTGNGEGKGPVLDPYEAALIASKGKRKLKALPRGTEDTVLGYWRFERSEEESNGEKVREKELRRILNIKSIGSIDSSSITGGYWGLPNGGSNTKENLSPWFEPIIDLTRYGNHGILFDSLWLFARYKGGKTTKDMVPASALPVVTLPTTNSSTKVYVGDLAPYARIGYGSMNDAPCDPGDPTKVREPRVLVGGIALLPDPAKLNSNGSTTNGSKTNVQFVTVPAPTRIDLTSLVKENGSKNSNAIVDHTGLVGLPSVSLTPSLGLLSTLYAWGMAVPIRPYSYMDIGVRPFDSVNAVFTFEAYVKVGNPYPTDTNNENSNLGGGDSNVHDHDDDNEGMGNGKRTTNTANSSIVYRPMTDLVIVSRTERTMNTNSQRTIVNARIQWQLVVRPDGALAFNAFPGTNGSSNSTVGMTKNARTKEKDGGNDDDENRSDDDTENTKDDEVLSPIAENNTVVSNPNTVPFGEWQHIAIVVDGSAAAKEISSRLKIINTIAEKQATMNGTTANTTKGGKGKLNLPTLPTTPLPKAHVRLFVNGEQVEEGTVNTQMPLPVLDDRVLVPLPTGNGSNEGVTETKEGSAVSSTTTNYQPNPSPAAGTMDYLMIGPDFIGRLSEVRLWAKKRSGDELLDTKDFHLDMAESRKTKMSIQIRPATLPVTTVVPPPVTVAGSSGSSTTSSASTPVVNSSSIPTTATVSTPGIKKLGAPGGGGGGGLAPPPTGTIASATRKRIIPPNTVPTGNTSGSTDKNEDTSKGYGGSGEGEEKVAKDSSNDDAFDNFGTSSSSSSSSKASSVGTVTVTSTTEESSDTNSSSNTSSSNVTSTPVRKPLGSGGLGLGLGLGLGAPPASAATVGKKAAMMKARQQQQQPSSSQ